MSSRVTSPVLGPRPGYAATRICGVLSFTEIQTVQAELDRILQVTDDTVRAVQDVENRFSEELLPGAAGTIHRLDAGIAPLVTHTKSLIKEFWQAMKIELESAGDVKTNPRYIAYLLTALDNVVRAFLHEMLWLCRIEHAEWTASVQNRDDPVFKFMEGAVEHTIRTFMRVTIIIAHKLGEDAMIQTWKALEDHILISVKHASWTSADSIVKAYTKKTPGEWRRCVLHPVLTNKNSEHHLNSEHLYGEGVSYGSGVVAAPGSAVSQHGQGAQALSLAIPGSSNVGVSAINWSFSKSSTNSSKGSPSGLMKSGLHPQAYMRVGGINRRSAQSGSAQGSKLASAVVSPMSDRSISGDFARLSEQRDAILARAMEREAERNHHGEALGDGHRLRVTSPK